MKFEMDEPKVKEESVYRWFLETLAYSVIVGLIFFVCYLFHNPDNELRQLEIEKLKLEIQLKEVELRIRHKTK